MQNADRAYWHLINWRQIVINTVMMLPKRNDATKRYVHTYMQTIHKVIKDSAMLQVNVNSSRLDRINEI